MKEKILVLLQELKGGNYSTFDDFYRTTYRLFYTIAYGVLKNKELVEEAIQESYVAVYKNLDKIKLDGNVMSYLYTIVKNKSLNILKKQKDELDIHDEKVEMVIGDRNLKPFKDENLLNDCRKILSEQEYEVITLSVIKGFKRREIAEMTNSNINTVTWRYQQALKKLQNNLKEENYEH